MSKGADRGCPILQAAVWAVAALLLPRAAGAGVGDPTRGQSLFVGKGCVQCHAVRGAGGRIGPDLGRTAVKGSFSEIAAAMWNHSAAMDEKMRQFRLARPSFEKEELADLLAFLYFLNYFDEPGDPRAGKILFAQKHCIQCHSLGSEGGTIGPRLDALPRGTAPLRIAQDLWNHGPVMVPAIRRMGLDVPKFEGSEIIDLFAYLRSHGQRRAAREFRSSGDPVEGKRLFATKGCSRCHAVFGKGAGIGPDLGKTELRGSVTQLAGRMWNHWPAMSEAMGALGMAPPTFRRDELADVFAYLFISRYDGKSDNPKRGADLYRLKGCATCHGPAGEGDIGPSLRKITVGESKEAIFQRLWNHAPKMRDKMGIHQIPWPRFEADELAALLALLGEGWNGPAAVRPAARGTRESAFPFAEERSVDP
jgi:mono/diheme cytochrome c family protein